MKVCGVGRVSNESTSNNWAEGKRVGMWKRLLGRGHGLCKGSVLGSGQATCKETAALAMGWRHWKC